VASHLVMLATKGANSTIRPTAACKAIARPHAVLDSEPREDLAFWRCPNLPHDMIHARADGALKLIQIRQGARIDSAICELPRHGVRSAVL
jgi:hypothetical protein